MSASSRGFDRLAPWYRALEFAAFGRDLERARFEFLGRLRECRDILLLGEGDGRCALRVASAAPQARIVCVDSSGGMIAQASARLARTPHAARVSFLKADLRSYAPAPGSFDAVTTLFVLDCFDTPGVASVIERVSPALRPGAVWLFADFVLPAGGLARVRARAWLGLLYAFFRLETGLAVSRLPDSEAMLAASGWGRAGRLDLQWGLVRSALYERRPP